MASEGRNFGPNFGWRAAASGLPPRYRPRADARHSGTLAFGAFISFSPPQNHQKLGTLTHPGFWPPGAPEGSGKRSGICCSLSS